VARPLTLTCSFGVSERKPGETALEACQRLQHGSRVRVVARFAGETRQSQQAIGGYGRCGAVARPVPEPNWLPTTPPITAPRMAPAPEGRAETGIISMLVTWP